MLFKDDKDHWLLINRLKYFKYLTRDKNINIVYTVEQLYNIVEQFSLSVLRATKYNLL